MQCEKADRRDVETEIEKERERKYARRNGGTGRRKNIKRGEGRRDETEMNRRGKRESGKLINAKHTIIYTEYGYISRRRIP